jgi:hypothetical protein
MTIEPTIDGSTTGDSDPEAATTAGDAAPDAGDASQPKVVRAHAKTSGRAPRSRSKASTPPATKPALKAVMLGPATAIVPALEADVDDTTVRADRVEISQGGADRVEATTVSITQGGIGTADARTIDVRQGGIGRASATDIAVSQGGIGFAQGERVTLEMGAIGVAIGDEVRVTQSTAGYVAARGDATVDQSLVSTLIADGVTFRQPSAVLVLIARQVDGTVRPLLDWRGALAAGAVAGILIGLLRRGRR